MAYDDISPSYSQRLNGRYADVKRIILINVMSISRVKQPEISHMNPLTNRFPVPEVYRPIESTVKLFYR